MLHVGLRFLRLSLLGAIAALLGWSPASAETYNVDTELDLLAPDCSPGSGLCSLREAIRLSNSTPATIDVIYLPAGHYQLQLVGNDEDLNATGDLDILDGVLIFGAGALETVIDGRVLDRVFHLYHPAEQSVIDAVTDDSLMASSRDSLILMRTILGAPGLEKSMTRLMTDSILLEAT